MEINKENYKDICVTTKSVTGDYLSDDKHVVIKDGKLINYPQFYFNDKMPEWTDKGLELKVVKKPQEFHLHQNGKPLYRDKSSNYIFIKSDNIFELDYNDNEIFEPVMVTIPYMLDSIETRGIDFRYGYYECQFQCERKRGIWDAPAWLIPQDGYSLNDNSKPEIDFPEWFVKRWKLFGRICVMVNPNLSLKQ